MNKDSTVKELRTYLNLQDKILIAYLFGSLVKGKARATSDVDIAIVFDDLSLIERFDRKLAIANDLEELLHTKVDVVDLDSADPFFIHQVMIYKELIYEKDIHRRVEFEVAKRRIYFDMIPFYTLYHQQALKRLERKGVDDRNG